MKDRKYLKSHEWIKPDGHVGISDFAQKELGDIVFVELPEVGRSVNKGDSLGMIESVKASSEFYSPVSGKVATINDSLTATPELVNQQPYENGWLVQITPSNPAEMNELLDYDTYAALAEAGGH
ncbi:MAG: glycine cleavage system protein GcvH [Candidatus Wallbacteria bacterium]|nr:glycine cleavage system protein GcvH [Candidatus Wallbacteria bacterium]